MKKLLLLLPLSLLINSCSFVRGFGTHYFTQNTKEVLMQTDAKLPEQIQYYNDKRIVLQHISTSQQNFVTQGKAQFKRGKYIYTFIIPKYTPCIAKNITPDIQQMYFDGNSFLEFKAMKDGTDNAVYYFLESNGTATLYEGKDFTILKGATGKLKYKKLDNYKQEKGKKKAKGIKVS